jgi:hypothetical protein
MKVVACTVNSIAAAVGFLTPVYAALIFHGIFYYNSIERHVHINSSMRSVVDDMHVIYWPYRYLRCDRFRKLPLLAQSPFPSMHWTLNCDGGVGRSILVVPDQALTLVIRAQSSTDSRSNCWLPLATYGAIWVNRWGEGRIEEQARAISEGFGSLTVVVGASVNY